MGRREIRRLLAGMFREIVDYTENLLELNDPEWRKEIGVQHFKPVKDIKFSVIADTANGKETVTEEIFNVPVEYQSHA